jgi:hypothetical protein
MVTNTILCITCSNLQHWQEAILQVCLYVMEKSSFLEKLAISMLINMAEFIETSRRVQ